MTHPNPPLHWANVNVDLPTPELVAAIPYCLHDLAAARHCFVEERRSLVESFECPLAWLIRSSSIEFTLNGRKPAQTLPQGSQKFPPIPRMG